MWFATAESASKRKHFFKKRLLPQRLYIARKKKEKRLLRSTNLVHVVEFVEAKIIILRIPHNEIERYPKGQPMDAEPQTPHDLSVTNYPLLYTSPLKPVENPIGDACCSSARPLFADTPSQH